ncbi:hypothetical protein N0V88_001609 [Collariella sp. IMI 366227]|nr:hypothetical protein N0V88_001609 [Collariella sp. IMI 366227]
MSVDRNDYDSAIGMAEQERMHLQHDIFKMSQDGQLHLCPAGKDMPLHRVLDAGTANGLWAIDFGGWLEICDTILPATSDDGSLKEDSAFYQWNSLLVSAMEIRGASLASARHYKQQMLDVGFQDVHEVQYKWPIGTWAPDPKHKEVGYWMMANILSVFESSSLDPFTKVHGWSVEQINELIKRARTELLNDPSIHSYFPMRVVYGRKPF